MKLLHRLSALAMTAVMAFSISGGVSAANAATATIDTSRSTSLTLYKYDLTGAENDGVWDSQSYVSTGLADEQVNTALSQYAIEGVEFSYRKLADLSIYKGTAADGHQKTVPLYAFTENTKSGSKETIDFLSALGLTTNDAYRTDHDGKQNRVWYFKSDTLIEALDHALQTNSTSTKDALEKYMAANGGTAMPETDENGYSKVDGLAQGLYLLVETRVPENVTSTIAPFLVSLPMTTVDGSTWNYDLTLYPKNETGNPTLEKTVRESKADTGKNAGKTDDITDGYNHILTIYAVKTTTDSENPLDAVSMDEEHAEVLRSIFWDMTVIEFTTETYTEEITVEVPTEDSTDEDGMVEETQTVERTRLVISISGKSAQQMAEEYGFDEKQLGYVTELLSDEYSDLWASLSVPGVGSDDIVAVALSQVGNVGGQPYWSWYGFSSRVEWCACFVSWCADQCGYIESGVMPKHSYCPTGVEWFRSRGQWQDRNSIPAPGTIIYFDWGGDGVADHVGIVESCDGRTVYTIEGNANNACKQLSYAVGDRRILGYGTLSK